MSGLPARLVILASLDEPQSIDQIADTNDLPYQTVYTAAKELEAEGVLASHKRGDQRIYAPASPALPNLARTLVVDHSRDDWGQVFRGDRPILLHVLHRVGRPSLAAKVMDKAERTVHHAIQTHAPQGLLVKERQAYRINPRLGALVQIVEELAKLRAHHILQQVAPDARMLWSLGPEVLFRADEPPGDESVQPGALSLFAEYGIDLVMPSDSYFYRTHRNLDAGDAILQALLVDPESKRNRSYAALLYEQAQPEDLWFKAHIYGLADEAEAILQYVETHEPHEQFLPWEEHDALRDQYGVGE